MRQIRVLIAPAVLATLAVAAVAIGADERQSFAGSCSPIQGSTHFDPPVNGQTALHRFDFRGQGHCEQITINGQPRSDVPVKVHVGGPIEASCSAARGIEPVPGIARFSVGSAEVAVRFSFQDNMGTLTEFQGRIVGERSGKGEVKGTFLTPRTPPDTALKCATTGLADVPTDVSISTSTPIVSGEHVPRCHGRKATLIGTAHADALIGTRGPDVIVAGRGDDRVAARSGEDHLCGGAGADQLKGRGGDDVAYGGPGPDELRGGRGADRLDGGVGRDALRGGPGRDRCGGQIKRSC